MRTKAELQINKIITELTKNEYSRAKDIAAKCHLHIGSVYRIVKRLRENGTGVLGTRKGYVLSEYAKHSDDVEFVRRCMGRRTSDIMAISAAKKDILKRWRSIPHGKNNLSPLITHLSASDNKIQNQAQSGLNFMLSYVNEKGL